MEELQINPDEESLESSESREEMEALEETTHEPGAQIEQTGDIQTAEAVENAFKELAEEDPQVAEPGSTGINTVSKIDSFTREGEVGETVISAEETPILEPPPIADTSTVGLKKSVPIPGGVEVPNLESPPVVEISEEIDMSQKKDEIAKDPAYLEAQDGIAKDPAYLEADEGISKDPAYLEGREDISKDPAYLGTSESDVAEADSSPNEGIGEENGADT